MSWTPGTRVVTQQDHADWEQWRRESKRAAQRARRARYPRIDYYPDDDAATLIYSLTSSRAGGDLSSVINAIVNKWAQQRDAGPPEQTKAK